MYAPRAPGQGDNPAPDEAEGELREVALDLLSMALDLAGMVDPTPVSDGASVVLALTRGEWLDALISGVGVVPYVGDLAKAGKLRKWARIIDRALDLATRSPRAARALRPGIEKLLRALELLPDGVPAVLARLRERLRQFLRSAPVSAAARLLPDISRRFRFPPPRTVTKRGKSFQVQEAAGRLGVPGKVRVHRDKKAQELAAGGSGDHAGHLIAAEFGAPGGVENLTRQNWIQNSGQKTVGEWRQLEQEWGQKLRDGIGIEVVVRDYIPKGSTRPTHRIATWTEIGLDGSRTTPPARYFGNMHTPDWTTKTGKPRAGSRTAQKIEPTVPDDNMGTLHRMDEYKRRPR